MGCSSAKEVELPEKGNQTQSESDSQADETTDKEDNGESESQSEEQDDAEPRTVCIPRKLTRTIREG